MLSRVSFSLCLVRVPCNILLVMPFIILNIEVMDSSLLSICLRGVIKMFAASIWRKWKFYNSAFYFSTTPIPILPFVGCFHCFDCSFVFWFIVVNSSFIHCYKLIVKIVGISLKNVKTLLRQNRALSLLIFREEPIGTHLAETFVIFKVFRIIP